MNRCLLLVLLSGLLAAADPAVGEPHAPLQLWNRDIAVLRATVAGVAPEMRVQRIRERFEALPPDASDTVTMGTAALAGASGAIYYAGPHMLLAFSDGDADPETGVAVEAQRDQVRKRLEEALRARTEQRRPETLLRGLALSLAATLGLALGLWLLARLHRLLQGRVSERWFTNLPPIAGIDLRPAAVSSVHLLLRLPMLALAAILLYSWLTWCLGQFPYTMPWSRALGRTLLNGALAAGDSIIAATPGLFVVLVIALITRLVVKASNAFCTGIEEGRIQVTWMQPETAQATRRIASVVLWLFALIVAYPYMPGSSTDAFKGVSVFAGLMLTLGSAGMVNQVMSGLVVVYARTMKPGDMIKVGEVVGRVDELGFLSTKVRTPMGEEVSIPNAVLVGSNIVNYSRFPSGDFPSLSTCVTIGYDTPWRQVHAMLLLAAKRTTEVRADPEPFVLQRALSDFYVEYELRCRIERPQDRFRVLSQLHGAIQDVFNEHGVQIMSPHFIDNPAQPVVIPKDKWSPPPA
jgi:small-conductance mechanosensitive channel